MKKLPPFMLIKRIGLSDAEKPFEILRTGSSRPSRTPLTVPHILGSDGPADAAGTVDASVRTTGFSALVSGLASPSVVDVGRLDRVLVPRARKPRGRVVRRKPITVAASPHRVGVLDMGSWIGELPTLLARLNAAQSFMEIAEIQTPVPSGLVKSPEGMSAWLRQQTGKAMHKKECEQLGRHVIFDEFHRVAASIRKEMKLDVVVGLTPALVAGESKGDVYWNHFTSLRAGCVLVSVADLRQFAAEAGRPFEAAIGALLVPTLLAAFNRKLGFHEDRGCLFDYNADRTTFVRTVREIRIDDECLGLMSDAEREAAIAMLAVLRRMRRRRV